ncbi:MAG: cytochrome d ubiquinol oxidase subunit II, partial [Gaiellaceae bacterium]
MTLADLPAILILVGLAAYVVLGGADFGAGFWQLSSRSGERSRAIREHAYHAMGPVWEANHVWLIFVLVVCWTGYPTAFASIASTLTVPLFIAAIGIILRGTAYALRSTTDTMRGRRRVELLFAFSSILTPFAFGAAVGGIASGRVPVGNARGDLVTSWLNPTSIAVGVLAVATGAYLAAVYLSADAERIRAGQLVREFRLRALTAGFVAGAVALGALAAVRFDARPIWDGLTEWPGLLAVVVSAAAGIATLALVWAGSFGPARLCATLAVAAIVAGWALAQRPRLLPGLTIEQAAAPRATLDAIAIAGGIGAVVLVPSLALLFGLFLGGRFDVRPARATEPTGATGLLPAAAKRLFALLAATSGVAGLGLTTFTDSGWPLGLGVFSLFVFVGSAFCLVVVPP